MSAIQKSRILGRLTAVGRTASDASRDAGLDQGFIRDILRGKKKSVHADNLEKIAQVLHCSPQYLTGQQAHPLLKKQSLAVADKAVRLHGELNSNAWIEESGRPPRGAGGEQFFQDVAATIPPDPRFDSFMQGDYVVRDDSINLYAREGQVVRTVMLDTKDQSGGYRWPVRAGDFVLVQRRRGKLVQNICRQILMDEAGETIFAPYSSSDAWKPITEKTLGPNEDAMVLGVVLFAYTPLGPNRTPFKKGSLLIGNFPDHD